MSRRNRRSHVIVLRPSALLYYSCAAFDCSAPDDKKSNNSTDCAARESIQPTTDEMSCEPELKWIKGKDPLRWRIIAGGVQQRQRIAINSLPSLIPWYHDGVREERRRTELKRCVALINGKTISLNGDSSEGTALIFRMDRTEGGDLCFIQGALQWRDTAHASPFPVQNYRSLQSVSEPNNGIDFFADLLTRIRVLCWSSTTSYSVPVLYFRSPFHW